MRAIESSSLQKSFDNVHKLKIFLQFMQITLKLVPVTQLNQQSNLICIFIAHRLELNLTNILRFSSKRSQIAVYFDPFITYPSIFFRTPPSKKGFKYSLIFSLAIDYHQDEAAFKKGN